MCIRDSGYIPRQQTSPYTPPLATIGLILKAEPGRIPQANRFYSHVVAGIEMACRRQHTNLLYATMTVDVDSYPLELPRLLREDDTADGLLLVGAFLDDTLIRVIGSRSVPIVLVDAYARSGAFDSVISDNTAGASRMVAHLIAQGHRHIALVGSHPKAFPSVQERHQGYLQALSNHAIGDHYVAQCHLLDGPEIVDATTDLLRRHPQITAIFGVNDEVAITVIDAARGLGRQVPEDLSVCGFDNIDLADRVSPTLTTMHVDKIGMGRLGVQLLINRVEHPESSPVRVMVCPELIERESVCAI
jgi:LacI family transcriptional regulator